MNSESRFALQDTKKGGVDGHLPNNATKRIDLPILLCFRCKDLSLLYSKRRTTTYRLALL